MAINSKAKEKKELEPVRCACGKEAALVVFRGKKMVSCPNPERCVGNLRTQWHGTKAEAIAEWNVAVRSFEHKWR